MRSETENIQNLTKNRFYRNIFNASIEIFVVKILMVHFNGLSGLTETVFSDFAQEISNSSFITNTNIKLWWKDFSIRSLKRML